ncbi:MAG: hypothetical protein VKJ04_06750 [Vampirovibrionales bacterium]|nr:hypothetical protein [Vampirovibrionales bacterium]
MNGLYQYRLSQPLGFNRTPKHSFFGLAPGKIQAASDTNDGFLQQNTKPSHNPFSASLTFGKRKASPLNHQKDFLHRATLDLYENLIDKYPQRPSVEDAQEIVEYITNMLAYYCRAHDKTLQKKPLLPRDVTAGWIYDKTQIESFHPDHFLTDAGLTAESAEIELKGFIRDQYCQASKAGQKIDSGWYQQAADLAREIPMAVKIYETENPDFDADTVETWVNELRENARTLLRETTRRKYLGEDGQLRMRQKEIEAWFLSIDPEKEPELWEAIQVFGGPPNLRQISAWVNKIDSIRRRSNYTNELRLTAWALSDTGLSSVEIADLLNNSINPEVMKWTKDYRERVKTKISAKRVHAWRIEVTSKKLPIPYKIQRIAHDLRGFSNTQRLRLISTSLYANLRMSAASIAEFYKTSPETYIQALITEFTDKNGHPPNAQNILRWTKGLTRHKQPVAIEIEQIAYALYDVGDRQGKLSPKQIAEFLNTSQDPHVKILVDKFVDSLGHPITRANIGRWVEDSPRQVRSKAPEALRQFARDLKMQHPDWNSTMITKQINDTNDPELRHILDTYGQVLLGQVYRWTSQIREQKAFA